MSSFDSDMDDPFYHVNIKLEIQREVIDKIADELLLVIQLL